MIYDLKILPQYFEDVKAYKKNFELRKNDRDFKVGDTIILREWSGEYTGRIIERKIEYIYEGRGEYGLSKGYSILGLSKL